jgi:hypothetical protein
MIFLPQYTSYNIAREKKKKQYVPKSAPNLKGKKNKSINCFVSFY